MDHLLYNQKTKRQCIQLVPAVPSACNLVTTTFLPRRGLDASLGLLPHGSHNNDNDNDSNFLIWVERYNLQAPLHVVEHLCLTMRLQPRC